MPKYLLTGVDGRLSSIAASYALTLAQPGDQFVFTSPQPGLIAQPLLDAWHARGAQVLMVDHDDPANLRRTLAGVDAVALVSSPDYLAGRRRRTQHRNVIEAARAAGVRRIVYTSLVGAHAVAGWEGKGEEDEDEDVPALVRDHAYTEALVRASGLSWNIQRNAFFEIDTVADVLHPSAGAGDDARAAFVAREDGGRVLGALLMGKGEPDTVYTVTGPRAVSGREISAWLARRSASDSESKNSSNSSNSSNSKSDEGEGEGEGADVEARWRQRRLSDSWGRPTGLLGFEDVLGLGRLVASGHLADETDAVVRLTGRSPLGFEASLGGASRQVSC